MRAQGDNDRRHTQDGAENGPCGDIGSFGLICIVTRIGRGEHRRENESNPCFTATVTVVRGVIGILIFFVFHHSDTNYCIALRGTAYRLSFTQTVVCLGESQNL